MRRFNDIRAKFDAMKEDSQKRSSDFWWTKKKIQQRYP